MKRIMVIFSFLFLVGLSILITRKTALIIKSKDKLMITIKEVEKDYIINPSEAIIDNDTIIPGISGQKIDVDKSYNAMKKYGVFSSSLLKFSALLPKDTLNKNFDKYIISGNKNKKLVSLIFMIYDGDDIKSIINILDAKKIKGNFFVDGFFLEKNNYLIGDIIKDGHIIGNLGYNGDYGDASYIWMDTIIKRIGKQKKGYCYLENKNEEYLKICSLNKNYTIIPNLVLNKDYLINIKKKLENGMIISLDVNDYLKEELPVIIDYITSKGYEINNLDVLLSEKN